MRLNRRSLRSAHSEHSTYLNRPNTHHSPPQQHASEPGWGHANGSGYSGNTGGYGGYGVQGFGGNMGSNSNGYGNYNSHDCLYRTYVGPVAEHSERFAEWERKEEFEVHKVELFDGKLDLEGLQRWFRSVEHYGRLAGYSEQRVIEKSWKFFTAEVLDWFTLMLTSRRPAAHSAGPNSKPKWRTRSHLLSRSTTPGGI